MCGSVRSSGVLAAVIFGAVVILGVSSVGIGTLKAASHLNELRGKLVGERVLDPDDPADEPPVRALQRSNATRQNRTGKEKDGGVEGGGGT